MRALTATPPGRLTPSGIPVAETSSFANVIHSPSHDSTCLDTSPACSESSSILQSDVPLKVDVPLTPSRRYDDPAAEISCLKKEIKRLKEELRMIIDHTVESDTRLLQFTDEIFVANTSITDHAAIPNQAANPEVMDCGIQCELGSCHGSSDISVSVPMEDSAVSCKLLKDQPEAVNNLPLAEFTDIIQSLKTTIEVLTAENQWLKQQANHCECPCSKTKHSQPWIEVNYKKKKSPLNKSNNLDKPQQKKKVPFTQKTGRKKPKLHHPSNLDSTISTQDLKKHLPKLRFKEVTIAGDSHSRNIAGLVGGMVDLSTSVSGLCKPGARLLDIVNLDNKTPKPTTGPHMEVLIAGTNDLANGTQGQLYNYLERFVASRPASTELVIATLPHRHDLKDPDHRIHYETRLVNAYIEELAARKHFRVLRLDEMDRRHFTRHGQHLSLRGKRLLAKMLVRSLCLPRPRPINPTPRSARRTSRRAESSTVTTPGHKTFAEVVSNSTTAISPSSCHCTLSHDTYADAEEQELSSQIQVLSGQNFLGNSLEYQLKI